MRDAFGMDVVASQPRSLCEALEVEAPILRLHFGKEHAGRKLLDVVSASPPPRLKLDISSEAQQWWAAKERIDQQLERLDHERLVLATAVAPLRRQGSLDLWKRNPADPVRLHQLRWLSAAEIEAMLIATLRPDDPGGATAMPRLGSRFTPVATAILQSGRSAFVLIDNAAARRNMTTPASYAVATPAWEHKELFALVADFVRRLPHGWRESKHARGCTQACLYGAFVAALCVAVFDAKEPPEAPTDVVAYACGPLSLMVCWQSWVEAAPPLAVPVEFYEVEASVARDPTASPALFRTHGTSMTCELPAEWAPSFARPALSPDGDALWVHVRVRAINTEGSSADAPANAGSPVQVIGLPPQPVDVHVEALPRGAILVRWRLRHSSSAFRPTHACAVQISRDDSFESVYEYGAAPPSDQMQLTLASAREFALEPDVPYHIRVLARNAAGSSVSARSAHAVVLDEFEPPPPPAAVTFAAALGCGALLRWSAPAGRVIEYEIEAMDRARLAEGQRGWQRCHADALAAPADACAITALLPGRAYRYRVRARNLAGWGEFSAPTEFGPTDGAPPAAPLRLEVLRATSTTVLLSWLPPPCSGRLPLLRYVVQQRTVGSHCWEDARVASADADGRADGAAALRTFVEVVTLQPALRYGFRVSAANQAGVGMPSLACEPVSLAPPPLPSPSPPVCVRAGHDWLAVAWEPPVPAVGDADGITDYEVQASMTPHNRWVTVEAAPITVADASWSGEAEAIRPRIGPRTVVRVVRGLRPGEVVHVRVRARGMRGFGPLSEPSAPMLTLTKPPAAPVSVTASIQRRVQALLPTCPCTLASARTVRVDVEAPTVYRAGARLVGGADAGAHGGDRCVRAAVRGHAHAGRDANTIRAGAKSKRMALA